MINYIDRVNISHALVPLSADLELNPIQQGIILSAFSWGYVAFMPFGGMLVDRFGPMRVAPASVAAWSSWTALSGLSFGWFSLLLTRIMTGVSEAPIFPANASLVRGSFPVNERGRATAIFDSGSYVGVALSAPIVTFLIFLFDWRVSFIVCGCLGVVWILAWRRYASVWKGQNSTAECGETTAKVSWRQFFQILSNRKVLGASYGFFCYNYAKSFFLTWFPAYLISERGFSFIQVGFVGMIPPIFAIVGGYSAGAWTDRMITSGTSITLARKLPLCVGLLMSGSIVLSEYSDNQLIILALLSFSFASTIAASPGIWAIPGDIAPHVHLVGTIGGIQNTFSNMAGIVAPIITGIVVASTGSFFFALAITSVFAVTGAMSYWFVVGELRPISIGEGN